MAFTVEDFHDLIRLLEQQPDWRAELRRQLLSDDILTLPQLVRELVVVQQRTEVRLGELAEAQQRTEVRLAELAEAQQRAEERLGRVESRLERVENRLEGVGDRLERIERVVEQLAGAQQRTEVRVGDLSGMALEIQYQQRAFAYFRGIVLYGHALTGDELATLIEGGVERGLISDAEASDLALADVIVRGRLRENGREVHLVAEVSWGIRSEDVRRAADRAAVLAKLGLEAIPVVAGDRIVGDTAEIAQAQLVWQLANGHVVAPAAA